jgi:aconitate hydratase
MPREIKGVATIKTEDYTTTDHIIPAGSRMKYRSNVQKYSEFLFEVIDPRFYERAKKIKEAGSHNIIVGGLSYGQGSSREHAALCPMYMGVKAVIAKSFERIHTANLVNFGIVPLTFKNEEDYEKIDQDDGLEISDIGEKIRAGEALVVKNTTRGLQFEVDYDLSERAQEIVLSGGMLSYIKNKK